MSEPTYNQWQTSYDKWSGDLWRKLLDDFLRYFENDPKYRVGTFTDALWTNCIYCKIVSARCSECKLLKINACHASLVHFQNLTLTGQMFSAWMRDDKEEFEKLQVLFLQALKDTKFADYKK